MVSLKSNADPEMLTGNQLLIDLETSPGIDPNGFTRLLKALQHKKLEDLVTSGSSVGLRLWPENSNMSVFQKIPISGATITQ